MFAFNTAWSQEAKKISPKDAKSSGPEIGGHIESTFNWNFIQKNGDPKTNELRSYDSQANTFNLNAAHIEIKGAVKEKLSYMIQVDAGSDAIATKDATTGAGGLFDIQEAFITYSLIDMVSFTAGKFATFQGIEVIEGPDNPTVSRGYLYGLAEAFTLTGMFLELTPGKIFSLKLGAANDWDVMDDTNNNKTIIAQVGFDFGDLLSFVVSPFVGGETADYSIDVTGVSKLGSIVDINFQYIYGKLDSSKWWGAGIQPVIHITAVFDLALRYEIWKPDAVKAGLTENLVAHNVTITPTWKPMEGIMIRPEFRYDLANQEIFSKDNETGTRSKRNMTASIGTSYSF